MKYKSKFAIDEIVYYKLEGNLTRTLQVKAITFDGYETAVHCRRDDGSTICVRDNELMKKEEVAKSVPVGPVNRVR